LCGKTHGQKRTTKGKTMALPSQAQQKTKPLIIAIGVIALIVVVITQAPEFVRSLSTVGG
jgi:hypothetical protein